MFELMARKLFGVGPDEELSDELREAIRATQGIPFPPETEEQERAFMTLGRLGWEALQAKPDEENPSPGDPAHLLAAEGMRSSIGLLMNVFVDMANDCRARLVGGGWSVEAAEQLTTMVIGPMTSLFMAKLVGGETEVEG